MEACTPRQSVFSTQTSDTVYNLDQLNTIPADEFFEENYVTSGMRQLLTEVFSRMDGSNPDANGAFLLSQSMGGGKTHNLLALGLLAKTPELRDRVMAEFYQVRELGPVKVITFSGRQNPDYGIWGDLADQLGRSEVLNRFYQPLRAPGESDWVRLLQGEPTLILIDELPPYLNQMLQVSLGQSTLAHATQSALSNLLAAINNGKLPNVTLVLTDLSGSSYSLADDRLSGVLGDMEKEAERTVQTISPVRLDTPELYEILRKRLFAALPPESTVDEIASAFRASIEEAGRALDVPTDRASDLQSGIRQTYPFHPSMQDIFARFRENQGYQQTRALIRIMRLVIAGMWNSGLARERFIIGVHDVDPGNSRLASELEKINDRFGNAIAHDITKQTGDAVAQIIDGKGSHAARDAAHLILMSSLSQATNPVLGLTRAEIISYLASPGRNVGDLNTALSGLLEQAWYLHATADNRILFRTTENVRARLDSSVKNVNNDTVRNEVAKRIAELYRPVTGDVYQHVEALPDLKDVAITQDRTTLIIARPEAAGSTMLQDYYNSLAFKNRVLFVTSREEEYAAVVRTMRFRVAIEQMVKEFERSYRPDDPQLVEARDLETQYQANVYQALRQAFFTLYSPSRRGLLSTEFDPVYSDNKFQGEAVIRDALLSKNQYVAPADMMTDAFRDRIEQQLWPAESKQVSWTQIRTEAAQDASFPLHRPAKLDDVRDQAVNRGQWRLIDNGRFVERGPFEKPKARVAPPRPIRQPDPETGAVTLKIDAVNADQVKFIAADGSEQIVQGGQITLSDLSGSFVAIDTTGEHESEPPTPWQNAISIRHGVHQDGNVRRVELKAVPATAIRYTTDGGSPVHGGQPYTGSFVIGHDAVKVLALAHADGVQSKIEEFNIPGVTGKVTVDDLKPASWRRPLESSQTAETFEMLSLLEQYGVTITGITLSAESGQHYSSWSVDPDTALTVEHIRDVADLMTKLHPGWPIRMEISRTSYRGRTTCSRSGSTASAGETQRRASGTIAPRPRRTCNARRECWSCCGSASSSGRRPGSSRAARSNRVTTRANRCASADGRTGTTSSTPGSCCSAGYLPSMRNL